MTPQTKQKLRIVTDLIKICIVMTNVVIASIPVPELLRPTKRIVYYLAKSKT